MSAHSYAWDDNTGAQVCGRLKDLMKRKLDNGKSAYCKRVTWHGNTMADGCLGR